MYLPERNYRGTYYGDNCPEERLPPAPADPGRVDGEAVRPVCVQPARRLLSHKPIIPPQGYYVVAGAGTIDDLVADLPRDPAAGGRMYWAVSWIKATAAAGPS